MYSRLPELAFTVYDAGDSSTRRLLIPGFYGESVAVSPDESTLYVARDNHVLAIDAQSGSYVSLGNLPDGDVYGIGAGIAVAIPEPAQLSMLSIVAFARASIGRVRRRRESQCFA
jgi:hypothetical protein